MDIAEIRRKAKELKAREEELDGVAGKATDRPSLEEAPLSEESLAAPCEDFILDDEGASNTSDVDDEVFELSRHAESDEAVVEKLVEDPPPFNVEDSSDGKSQEELPLPEEAADIFIDDAGDTDDTSIEDSVDSIMLPGEPSTAEPLEEESEVIGRDVEDEVDDESDIEDEFTICLEAITFMLDDEEYGIDMDGIKEVIKPRELTNVPRAPENIMGVLSLRGLIIPVMDLRKRLAMGYDKEGERIIIVRDGDELLGLVVGRIVGAVSLTRKSIEPPPSFSSIDGELISAICRYDGESFILLNIDRIVEKS